MSVLFINACAREGSRTLALAKNVMKDLPGELTEVNLNLESLAPLDGARLAQRDALARMGELDAPMFGLARQFAAADEIVIAAPFWDLSFPAMLKIYLEQITVPGITFHYVNGRPAGLCRAKRLTYVTTSGGPILQDFGYAYVKALAQGFYGIEKTLCVRAENLDVEEISAQELLARAKILRIE